MEYHTFPCGCRWPIVGPPPSPGTLPLMLIDLDPRNGKVPYTCAATWDLISRGETKSVFQLEQDLGRQWAKEMKPTQLEHLSALGALLRPGCLRAEMEPGVSMTSLYCKRKNGEKSVDSYHPKLDPILEKTYNVLTYQEQSMRIGREIAGFDLKNVDRLRKAIGKKDQKEMAEVRELFLAGAKEKAVVPYETAEIIWGWIQKSGRYQFNKAHSYSYGVVGYLTAYCKVHFSVQYLCSCISSAHQKSDGQDEVRELIFDARLHDVSVNLPDIAALEAHAQTDFKATTFGLADLKNIGDKQVARLVDAVRAAEANIGKPITAWLWYDFVVRFAANIPINVLQRFARCGVLRRFGISRNRALHELTQWAELTEKEQTWIQERATWFQTLTEAFVALGQPRKQERTIEKKVVPKNPDDPNALVMIASLESEYGELCQKVEDGGNAAELIETNRARYKKLTKTIKVEHLGPEVPNPGGCANEKRRQAVLSMAKLLENPPMSMEDFPNWIATQEEDLLGVAVSCSRVAGLDASEVNTTCKEFLRGSNGKNGYIVLGVEIADVREKKCKNGKSAGRTMAYFTVFDDSAALGDVICFADVYEQIQHVVAKSNCVLLQGSRDKKRGGFIVKQAVQM